MAEIRQVLVPDIGDFKEVSVIDVMVKAGDKIQVDENLLTLETDKAAMDVPSPYAGVIKEMKVKVGDKVSEGMVILLLESSAPEDIRPAINQAVVDATPSDIVAVSPVAGPKSPAATVAAPQVARPPTPDERGHASPAIRRLARELGVKISQVKGSGEKGRVTKADVQSFIKSALAQQGGGGGISGPQIPTMPVVDFAKFGAIETKPLSRIKRISGANLHRNWVTIPHVTQFDEADITEMEAFRKELGAEYAKQGVKITLLAFLLKAVVVALQKFPEFNASLDAGGENLVLKHYFHIGVAVDTPDGLMVPVLRDVDKKGIVQLAREVSEISQRTREKKLSAAEMQGGCFSISSLGGIGGTAFTPIINAPELAILGVSKATIKPMHQDETFVARVMLPLSLSYDHRVIDGATAARFTVFLAQVLSDPRRLAL